MNINQRVQNLLDNSKLTQKELSKYISVASSTLNNWIKLGRSIPSEYIIPICEFFGVTVDYLLTGTETKHSPVPETKTEQAMSDTSKELLEVFESLPMRERVKLLSAVYDFQEQYNKNGTADITQPELPPLNNPLISQNEQKLLEVFQNFTEMEQVKIIERIEEWLETKRRRESENNQPQSQITIDPKKPWRLTARRTDGVYESRLATPEEIEKLKLIIEDSENNPEPEY